MEVITATLAEGGLVWGGSTVDLGGSYKGAFAPKNAQNFYFRPIGSWEIHKTKVSTDLQDTPVILYQL